MPRVRRVAFVGARVRFDPVVNPDIRQYITETLWHGSQQVEDWSDGRFIFQVEVSEPREVGWWALQWGACAEVLEPEGLRQEMAETLRKMSQLYEI